MFLFLNHFMNYIDNGNADPALFDSGSLELTALSSYVTDIEKDQIPLNIYNRTGPNTFFLKRPHYLFSVSQEKPISESSQSIRFSSGFIGLYDSVVK